ncbi:hypothetical protein C8J57DRAFT_1240653 [Mycena rebaudengoi]|nr:hypothetical protein C8J57DRAFT_1240653 [Mycena rebaudengoi]
MLAAMALMFAQGCSIPSLSVRPRTATFPHIDFGNLAWGLCAITALGWFNPAKGGHLPPFQYQGYFTPASIFRWAYNGFKTEKAANAGKGTPEEWQEVHEWRLRDRAARWKEGVKMYT